MTRFVVVIGFLIAFAAGLAVGLRPSGRSEEPTTRPATRGGWLAAELNLTPSQHEKLDAIWSETVRRGERDHGERRRQLYRERDEAIAALIRPEDKPRYDEIMKTYADRGDELEREWRESFQEAVDRTKQILTPEQRSKYEELLRRHGAERERHDRRRGSHGATKRSAGPETRPASRP